MNIAQVVKKCAMDAFDASAPCDVFFGRVIRNEPVEVQMGELNLTEDIVKVCEHLKYKEIKVNYGLGGDRTVVINEGIKIDDILVLLRKSGGESYIAVGKI